MLCFRNILVAKKFMDKREGKYKDFLRKFLVSLCRIAVREPSSLSLTSVIKKVRMRGSGGVSNFSVESFLSHSAEIFCRWTLYCIIIYGYRKYFCFRGLCRKFPSKIFRLTLLNHLVDEPFCVLEFVWYRKMLRIRDGAGITIFCQNVLSYSTEKLRRGTQRCCVSENFR